MNKKRVSFKAQQFQKGRVDFDNRIIRDVVLIEPNREATGHGMYVDQEMVNQVVEMGKAGGDVGFKARFDHPGMCFSTMGSQLGRLKNFSHSEDGKAIADLHIGSYTKDSPSGDIGKWLLGVANEDPDQIGFSIVFTASEPVEFEPQEGDDKNDPSFKYPHARIDTFHGADVVDEGAATSSLFQEKIVNETELVSEKIEKFFDSKPELLSSLMPLIEKLQKKYNTNTNQNQSKMSDDKTLLAKIGELISSSGSSEAVNTPEAPEVIIDNETHLAELSEKDAEIKALKAEIEAGKEKNEEQRNAFKSELSELKTQIESLSWESIGGTIEDVSTEDTSVEPSDSEKDALSKRTIEENIAYWASEESKGNSATVTYKNN